MAKISYQENLIPGNVFNEGKNISKLLSCPHDRKLNLKLYIFQLKLTFPVS